MLRKTDRYIADRLPFDFFDRISAGEFNRPDYPPFSDREAWKKAASSCFAPQIIALADAVPADHVPLLLYSNYCRYNTDGDRISYEKPYFERRKNLAALAVACCLTGDTAKYMPRLLDYVSAILEEWNWCLPAHVIWQENSPGDWRFCDLFCAETGAVLALLYSILGEELDRGYNNSAAALPAQYWLAERKDEKKMCPPFSERLRQQVLDRTLRTVFSRRKRHWWLTTIKPANWSVWCSYNCLETALLLEKDHKKLASCMKSLLGVTSRFINFNSDDGYCSEGPSYCNKANHMVLRTLLLLNKVTPGCTGKLVAEPKIRALAEFISHLRIGEKYQLSFGDSQPFFSPDMSVIVPAAELFKSKRLAGLAAITDPLPGHCGDYLKEFLTVLFDRPESMPQELPEEQALTVFPDRLAIMRSKRFSLALKAGNNLEKHNHNDLGHFTLYDGSTPVIIDAGTGDYGRINFSDQRYTLWNTRGSGHNAPVVNGVEQLEGAEYTADFRVEENRIICCDLSRAYPPDAGIRQFVRRMEFSPEAVSVQDTLTLEKDCTSELLLITPQRVDQLNDGSLMIGKVKLVLSQVELAGVEELPDMLYSSSGKAYSIWGGKLSGIRLKTTSCSYKLDFIAVK